MQIDITIMSKETKRKVFVSSYDQGAFINIMGRGFSAYTPLDAEETQQLIEALQETLKKEETT
jgi:hypothetical protein